MVTRAEICIGVISDTHGLLRAEAEAALEPADLIVHAGDIGCPTILDSLRRIAPVRAVKGNTDFDPWAQALPRAAVVEVGAVKLYLLHDLLQLGIDPAAADIAVVVSGHTHRAAQRRDSGVLYFNPGSAGPRRRQPPSVGLLKAGSDGIVAEVIRICC